MATYDRCGNSYDRCAEVLSSKCVSYQGDEIPCLDICANDSVSVVIETIGLAVCDLITATDVSAITIPTCLTAIWGTTTSTIPNYIQVLLNYACTLKGEINTINTNLQTFDPFVTIDFKCCESSPCVSSGTQKVSEAIQSTVNCLCDVKSDVTNLSELAHAQADVITTLQGQIDSLNASIAAMLLSISEIRVCTGCS